jgi:predicted membrane GTPase involved in stress response
MEPVEELTIDVDNQYVGDVKSEIGRRRGMLLHLKLKKLSIQLDWYLNLTTKGILGLRGALLTLSKGTAY